MVRIEAAAAVLPTNSKEAAKTLVDVMSSDLPRQNAAYAARVLIAHDPARGIIEADRRGLLGEVGLRSELADAVLALSTRAVGDGSNPGRELPTTTLMKAARLSRSAKALELAELHLSDANAELRLEAALTLSDSDWFDGAIEPLKALLSHPKLAPRAADALAVLGEDEGIQWLFREARAKRGVARRNVLEALVRADATQEALSMLVTTSRSKTPGTRQWAARQLADTRGHVRSAGCENY